MITFQKQHQCLSKFLFKVFLNSSLSIKIDPIYYKILYTNLIVYFHIYETFYYSIALRYAISSSDKEFDITQ